MSPRPNAEPEGKNSTQGEERAGGEGQDVAADEPAPLAERQWRHPWSHRVVRSREVQES